MVRNGRRRNYMFLPKQVADYVTPGKNQILHLFRAISFALRSYTTTLHAEMQSIATIGQNSDLLRRHFASDQKLKNASKRTRREFFSKTVVATEKGCANIWNGFTVFTHRQKARKVK
jgi:hypothetical protein